MPGPGQDSLDDHDLADPSDQAPVDPDLEARLDEALKETFPASDPIAVSRSEN